MNSDAFSCRRFRTWLDEGRPTDEQAPARAHAVLCAACTAGERAALEVDRLLALGPGPGPVGLVENVLQRISRTGQGGLLPTAPDGGIPWWVRAAGDPGFVFAMALVGLWVGWADRWPSVVGAAHLSLRSWMAALASESPAFTRPDAWIGLAMALAPLAWLAAQALYGASAAWTRQALRISTRGIG